jgi:hypothetical protein
LEEWLQGLEPGRILRIDATGDDPQYQSRLADAFEFIANR